MCGESDRKRRIDMSHDGPGSAHLHSPLTPQLRELTYVFLPFALRSLLRLLGYIVYVRPSRVGKHGPSASRLALYLRFAIRPSSMFNPWFNPRSPTRRVGKLASGVIVKTSEAKTQRERLRRHESRPDTQLTSTGPRATSPRPTTGHLPVRYPSRLFVTVPDHVHTVVH
jgi:hypothetical protein